MEDKKSPRDIAEIVESTMYEFNVAMKRREVLIVKMGTQTAQIVRVSMIGLILLMSAMFALITILVTDMGDITKRLDDIAKNMQKISENIIIVAETMRGVKQSVDEVKLSIDQVNKHVKVMPLINVSINKISDNMLKINTSIKHIDADMASLNNNIKIIGVDMANIRHQFTGLNHKFGAMGYNVDRMASPIKMFPFP